MGSSTNSHKKGRQSVCPLRQKEKADLTGVAIRPRAQRAVLEKRGLKGRPIQAGSKPGPSPEGGI